MTETGPSKPTITSTTATDHDVIQRLLKPFEEQATATRHAIEERTRGQRRINRALLAFVTTAVILIVLILVILVQNRAQAAKTREVIRNNAQVSEQIADCTTVGGKCYEQGQQRLGAAYEYLTLVQITTSLCLRDNPDATAAQLKACVDGRLATAKNPTR